VGEWTKTAVLEVRSNPKYTGYMVWNRRKRHRPERQVVGKGQPAERVGVVAAAHP
jgi:hypothetical protein